MNATRTIAFILLMLCGIISSVTAQIDWIPLNSSMYGGTITSYAFDRNGSTLAAAGDEVYRLSADGNRWEVVYSGKSAKHIVVAEDGSWIVTDAYGIHRSEDAGNTWTNVQNASGTMLKVLPGGQLAAFNQYNSYFYRSTDNGRSWKWNNLPDYNDGLVDITAYNNDTIFGLLLSGMATSYDGGVTWSKIGLAAYPSNLIAPSNKVLVSSNSASILRSTDDGNTWKFVDSLAVESFTTSTNGTVYAMISHRWHNKKADSTARGIYRINSDGTLGKRITDRIANHIGSLFAIAPDTTLWLTAASESLHSTDNGTTWNALRTGLNNNSILSLTEDSSGSIFALTSHGSLFRSTNGGASWEWIRNGLTTAPYASTLSIVSTTAGLFAAEEKEDRAFAPDYKPVYYTWYSIAQSVDGGNSWRTLHGGVGLSNIVTGANGLIAYGTMDRIIQGSLGGIFDGSLVVSSDNGETWTIQSRSDMGNLPAMSSVAMIPAGDIFAAGYNRSDGGESSGAFVRSTDHGSTWHSLIDTNWPGIVGQNIVYDVKAATDGKLYAATRFMSQYSIIGSDDNGETWNTLLDSVNVEQLFLGPDGTVFAINRGYPPTLLRSTDKGATWAAIDSNLWSLHTTISGHIIARKGGPGLSPDWYQSSDNGDTWINLTANLPGTRDNIYPAILELSDGYLLAGTDRHGVFRSARPASVSTPPIQSTASTLTIEQNTPNPFTGSTIIPIQLPHAGRATLRLHDLLGHAVATLIDRNLPEGRSEIEFNPDGIAPGVYLLRLHSGTQIVSRKLVIEE